jgi:hypothetical protein
MGLGALVIYPLPRSIFFSRLEDPWDSKDGVTAEGPSRKRIIGLRGGKTSVGTDPSRPAAALV